MDIDQVPQEGNRTLGGHRKALYARDADGRIGLVPSRGWEAEEIVTRQAVEELDRLTAEARQRAIEGTGSALEFHMYKARMDSLMLAQVTGLWHWRVRRHLRPEIFRQLRPALLARYAEALGIAVTTLTRTD
ncbi:hypothetical protein CJ010_01845 [Azoarcus sp. DD4]|uniref:hypothetical protein n=1 Tax=Azoarcus sp. DD4 TaxID=2027405 RepID=UPI001128C822|nr:hypothetical protein [Azoarcus sp. DD4]QDF95381.1 hypothetical protein CJ010_01845 [Azoarcus sp. DD4]